MPNCASKARMLVIGDLRRMQLAMDIVSSPLAINKVAGPAEALFAEGTIDVLDMDCIPVDLPWGELSAAAGHAAYLFIEKAVQLVMAHEVDAICTGPLNKAALHAAGHKYPGHTELLASLTGTEEVSMMLTAPKMRVIHVTTHIGLIDAIAKINGAWWTAPSSVATAAGAPPASRTRASPSAPSTRTPARADSSATARRRRRSSPAIEKAQAEGIDAFGPLPADTLFFLAGRGDFDLVVAQYHDQGHGPVKVLGLENGVNITVGLPVVRTSVDHGTAFDIAGEERGRPRVPAGGPAPGGGPGARAQRESIGDCKKTTGSDS